MNKTTITPITSGEKSDNTVVPMAKTSSIRLMTGFRRPPELLVDIIRTEALEV